MVSLPDGLAVVVKRDCPTCELITPVLRQLAGGSERLTVLTQDDPAFPPGIKGVLDDTDLERSWHLNIETVPTVIRIVGGRESARAFGWHRGEWETLTGVRGLGEGLPAERPGCGSKTVDPGMVDELELRFGGVSFASRPVEIGGYEDDVEACFERDWSDGLPVVPPTPVRVLRMLRGTTRDPKEVLGMMPPDYPACTVEKVAINAVMAGCKPQYLPVLIAAVDAVAAPEYNLYGRQTTTHPGAHLIIVNGPIRHELDVNCKGNVFGQGWRANATLGRALRLVLINVAGNQPGITDMATHGHPGKYTFCMGEDEEGSPWAPLHVERGFAPGTSAVTVYCAEAPHNINDQVSKTPQMYLGSAASTMATLGGNGVYRSSLEGEQGIVITSESAHWIAAHGWSKRRVQEFLWEEARQPVRLLRDRGAWGKSPLPDWIDPADDDAMVPIVAQPERIVVLVAGGHQRHMNALLTAGYSASQTRAIGLVDGTPVASVQDFLR